MYRERLRKSAEGVKMGLDLGTWRERLTGSTRGWLIVEMTDARTRTVLLTREMENIITLDAGILAARLFKNSMDPNAGQNNGLKMLAIGTGAVGNLLSPDAPQATQRKLNVEIFRKAFSSVQFRNEAGIAVSIPTHIVDFTTTYGESEAVGPLNEMGLISPYSTNPSIKNPIDNGSGTLTPYDPSIDVTTKDLLANYITFSVISKPATALLTITWRLTF